MSRELEITRIKKDWSENPRLKGVKRGYTAEDVYRLRGSLQVEHTLARRGAEKLWQLLHERPYVNSLGALTGNQALQQVKAGVPASRPARRLRCERNLVDATRVSSAICLSFRSRLSRSFRRMCGGTMHIAGDGA